jgi:hypothetical protein
VQRGAFPVGATQSPPVGTEPGSTQRLSTHVLPFSPPHWLLSRHGIRRPRFAHRPSAEMLGLRAATLVRQAAEDSAIEADVAVVVCPARLSKRQRLRAGRRCRCNVHFRRTGPPRCMISSLAAIGAHVHAVHRDGRDAAAERARAYSQIAVTAGALCRRRARSTCRKADTKPILGRPAADCGAGTSNSTRQRARALESSAHD